MAFLGLAHALLGRDWAPVRDLYCLSRRRSYLISSVPSCGALLVSIGGRAGWPGLPKRPTKPQLFGIVFRPESTEAVGCSQTESNERDDKLAERLKQGISSHFYTPACNPRMPTKPFQQLVLRNSHAPTESVESKALYPSRASAPPSPSMTPYEASTWPLVGPPSSPHEETR